MTILLLFYCDTRALSFAQTHFGVADTWPVCVFMYPLPLLLPRVIMDAMTPNMELTDMRQQRSARIPYFLCVSFVLIVHGQKALLHAFLSAQGENPSQKNANSFRISPYY